MNILEKIYKAINGNTNKKLPNPSRVCVTDDDYIYYANYCGNLISLLKADLLVVNFHSEDFNQKVNRIMKSIDSAHSVLGLCYQFLRLSGKRVNHKSIDVYTSTISHERRT